MFTSITWAFSIQITEIQGKTAGQQLKIECHFKKGAYTGDIHFFKTWFENKEYVFRWMKKDKKPDFSYVENTAVLTAEKLEPSCKNDTMFSVLLFEVCELGICSFWNDKFWRISMLEIYLDGTESIHFVIEDTKIEFKRIQVTNSNNDCFDNVQVENANNINNNLNHDLFAKFCWHHDLWNALQPTGIKVDGWWRSHITDLGSQDPFST